MEKQEVYNNRINVYLSKTRGHQKTIGAEQITKFMSLINKSQVMDTYFAVQRKVIPF